MRKQQTSPATDTRDASRERPSWITAELVADTIRTWQPHYDWKLTERDAVEMLIHVGQLIDLMEADRDPASASEADEP